MGRKLIKAFELELFKLKDQNLKKIIKNILFECNDYNAVSPASSTGNFHPAWSAGEGGLIRHTKVVCKYVEILIRSLPQYDNEDWDLVYSAALLHDMYKYSENNQQYSNENHPNLIASKIREKIKDNKEFEGQLERIAQMTETHMSRWNTCKHSNDVMPIPSKMEHFLVSFADLIAADKQTIVKFDENNNITN